MDDATASTTNSKAMQQLRQKTDEVEKLFSEARHLEQENMQLRDAVTQSKRGLIEAENQLTLREAECRTLESTVRAQQTTIQELLNAELARASGKPLPGNALALPPPTSAGSAAAAAAAAHHRASAHHQRSAATKAMEGLGEGGGALEPPPAVPSLPPEEIARMEREHDDALQQIESLQSQLRHAAKAADEFKKGAAIHADEMNRLQHRVKAAESEATGRVDAAEKKAADATEKATALQEALGLMRDQHKQLIAEAQHLEGVDAQAREGVRVEWLALASENERLMRVADEAAAVQTRVRQEHERVVAQLVSQRTHFDSSAAVLRRELEAVHEENDRLLVNFQRVAAERDALRRDLDKAEALAKQQLDVDSSIVVSRDLRRQIAEATAGQQADAQRAAGLERELGRTRDDLATARAEVERARGDAHEAGAKLNAAKRDLEIAKQSSGSSAGDMQQMAAALADAQRQLQTLQHATDSHGTDAGQQLFIDEVDATTNELVTIAHEAASFLAPVPVSAPSVAPAGSPRQYGIRQRLAELRGLLRWIHSTLGDITTTQSASAGSAGRDRGGLNSSNAAAAADARTGSAAGGASTTAFNLVPSQQQSHSSTARGKSASADPFSLRGSSADVPASWRDLSVQREPKAWS